MTDLHADNPHISATGSRRERVATLKSQLADEAFWARVRFNETGKRPTRENAPLLMDIWQTTWDALVADGPTRFRLVHRYKSLQFLVSTSWGVRDDLLKFQLHDRVKGVLLLVGDVNGPLFPATAQRANQPPTGGTTQ